ncbi:MAG TPA: hypothetical protein VK862_12950 [Afifellaceae bacterium]|nr:hypothetical protein [Afifellaceae bacterium]
MTDVSELIGTYISAKDGNRPWLTGRVFAEDARLEMIVDTDAISFPSTAAGVGAITAVLVREFVRDHENVYTLCLSSPPGADSRQFGCDFLVGMSRRDNGEVRVGCGSYDWSFTDTGPMLVDSLRITIAAMQVLAPGCLLPIMRWLSELPYPWCPARAAAESMPDLRGLEPVSDYLRRGA